MSAIGQWIDQISDDYCEMWLIQGLIKLEIYRKGAKGNYQWLPVLYGYEDSYKEYIGPVIKDLQQAKKLSLIWAMNYIMEAQQVVWEQLLRFEQN